jgi:hypothetical protein
MKTQSNTSNLKKMTTVVFATLMLFAVNSVQLRAEEYDTNYQDAISRLNNFVNTLEQSLHYQAPEYAELEDVTAEMERLEKLVATTEASLKYKAPEEEAVSLAAAMDRLETLAAATEASLKYVAPETEAMEQVVPELERLEMLVAETEASLIYRAPVDDQLAANENLNEQINEPMMEAMIK